MIKTIKEIGELAWLTLINLISIALIVLVVIYVVPPVIKFVFGLLAHIATDLGEYAKEGLKQIR